jgi:pilus assembly protein Flp/PilA
MVRSDLIVHGWPVFARAVQPGFAKSNPASAKNRGNREMTKLIRNLKNSKSGASAAEYALIIALVGLAIVVGATALGGAINQNFTDAGTVIGSNP